MKFLKLMKSKNTPSQLCGFLVFALLFTVGITQAQKRFNPLSLEIAVGTPVPVTSSPLPGVGGRLQYIGPNSLNLAMRYMFSEDYGLRGHYGRTTFQARSVAESNSVTYNRLGLEGALQLMNLFPIDYRIKEKFGLLMTGGLALSMAKSSLTSNTDVVGSLMGGGTLQIKLSEKMSLIGVGNGYINLSQSVGYDGVSKASGFKSLTLEGLIGLQWNLGDPKKRHADWY